MNNGESYPAPAEGDPVVVFDINGRRMGQPDGGWPSTVTKVGRKIVTVQSDSGLQTWEFRIGTRLANDDFHHQWFKTLDQIELDQRRHAAVTALAARRVRIESGSDLTLIEIEALAAALG